MKQVPHCIWWTSESAVLKAGDTKKPTPEAMFNVGGRRIRKYDPGWFSSGHWAYDSDQAGQSWSKNS